MAEPNNDVTQAIHGWIDRIDGLLSAQLNEILHHPDFQKLEGSWRGLHYLAMQTETSDTLQIRVLNVGKEELRRDLERAPEFRESALYQKVYAELLGTVCGRPFGVVVGDYAFGPDDQDVALLGEISHLAAAAFCPFLSSASPAMFGLQRWTELPRPRDLAKIVERIEYVRWQSFRESDDSRFVALVLPRALARLPYGGAGRPVEEFDYEEAELDADGRAKRLPHEHYTWMNAAYALAARMTDAFAKFGWCTAIRGVENGGMVEGLPADIFLDDDGEVNLRCPTEIGIGDRREYELASLGFLPLCHYRNKGFAVFYGAQTTHRPPRYVDSNATATAYAWARLPLLMAVSRIAHYLKVMARDNADRFSDARELEDFLNRWIANYVNSGREATPRTRYQHPFEEAMISVRQVPGEPGAYTATAFVRPLLMEVEQIGARPWQVQLPRRSDFRAPPVNPAWLRSNGGTVQRVAQAIHDGRRFAELPVLADALEEAGCTDARILDHCREEAHGHSLGCWVLDALLKE
jgi:type VI secretion system protein ImpC